MLGFKGFYEWELINADTKEVESSGSQDNIISDQFFEMMRGYPNWGMNIQLSDTLPTPGVDYRAAGKSASFNKLAESGLLGTTQTNNPSTMWVGYTFTPPGSPRLIKTIGSLFSKWYGINTGDFCSFIQLSVPITQQTNQYLYIKYTVTIELNLSGEYTPQNTYISSKLRSDLFTSLGIFIPSNENNFRQNFQLSYFREPEDKNNIAKFIQSNIYDSNDRVTNYGCTYATRYQKSFTVDDVVGAIGSLTFGKNYFMNPWRFFGTIGYSKLNSTPSISRVFAHPNKNAVFSDPANPPNSVGIMTALGTPTNKVPLIVRAKIDKSGDASDITDDTFIANDVTDELEFSISQDWVIDDIIRVSGGSLPTPLVEGVDYYITAVNGLNVQVSLTKQGSVLDLGSGSGTASRQNTGTYSLELEPWLPTVGAYLSQLSLAVDYAGNISHSTDPSTFLQPICSCKNGDYLYGIYPTPSGRFNVCRWFWFSIESPKALLELPSIVTSVVSGVKSLDDNKMYMATNDGVYVYDMTNPLVVPTKLAITNLIDESIQDITIDPITGYLWTGHTTGMCKVDLGTLVAIKYISGSGEKLEGMDQYKIIVCPGQLQVYDGKVLKGGGYYQYTPYIVQTTLVWLFDDNTSNWLDITESGYYASGCSLRIGYNNQVMYHDFGDRLRLVEATLTGKNTGTINIIETFIDDNPYIAHSNFIRMGSDTFCMVTNEGILCYIVGQGIYNLGNSGLDSLSSYSIPYLVEANKNIIWADGVPYFIVKGNLIKQQYTNVIPYGWDGSNWVKNGGSSRNIPKTVNHSIMNGVSLDFNNAPGYLWNIQFVAGDRFAFMTSFGFVKDNLQTFDLNARYYFCDARHVESLPLTIANTWYDITERSDPDFRDMDILDYVTKVYDVNTDTFFTQGAWSTGISCTVTLPGIFTLSQNIPTGTVVDFTTNGVFPTPLDTTNSNPRFYYAINVSPTEIKLALTYADAMANIPIVITNVGSGYNEIRIHEPTTLQYHCNIYGQFVFSSADVGKPVQLTYTYTLFN